MLQFEIREDLKTKTFHWKIDESYMIIMQKIMGTGSENKMHLWSHNEHFSSCKFN